MAGLATSRGGGAPSLLDGLNPEQRRAVETIDGPVLVLAGAGTGKTRVLTHRLAHILRMGRAYPSQILCVTFTNKAAREMRERATKLIGQVEGLPWLGTFHSISAKILRIHAELVGLKSTFTILDTDDQLRLMKQIIQAAGLDPKRWTARHLASLVDGWKNKGLTPDRLSANDGFSFGDGKGRELYKIYQNRLRQLNAVDFGDLLLHCVTIFKNNPEVLAKYHAKFKYILVDEYQDTNVSQYLWLRLLAQGSQNLCVVGDDDQSIYGWRGAEVDNILRFESDFPGAAVIKLERNYRSTEHILAAASGLIAANEGRLGKTLWTEDAGGEKVVVAGVWDGQAEARAVSTEIENWKSKDGRQYNDISVLVRASRQMRAFEERFIMLGLPYRVIGGPRFFERQEIRDAHAYLRLIVSETDDLAFERVINKPKRGIGATSVQKLQRAARAMQIPLEAASREVVKTDEIRGRARTGIASFIRDLDRWRNEVGAIKHTELAERILDESGYTQMLKDEKDAKAAGRLENLKELVQAMAEFDTLPAYLEHVSLVMDIETAETDDKVSLMTLHSAKGLEFPLVFLPGWEDGSFPSQKSMDESGLAGLEEERRLAYVGITRAREKCMIYFAANRQVYGSWQSSLPSRFIDELPPKHVTAQAETGYYDSSSTVQSDVAERFANSFESAKSTRNSPGWNRYQANKDKDYGRDPKNIEGHAVRRPAKDKGSNFKIGERIFHQKFGYGKVTSADGTKLTVAFEKAGEKKVLDNFVEKT